MEKKYRLLKDLPGVKAGTVFVKAKDGDLPPRIGSNIMPWYSPKGKWLPQFSYDEMEDPEWFELDESKYTKEDMHGYALWLVRKFREQKEEALLFHGPIDFLLNAEVCSIEYWLEEKNKKS